jgi:hypothetical protein
MRFERISRQSIHLLLGAALLATAHAAAQETTPAPATAPSESTPAPAPAAATTEQTPAATEQKPAVDESPAATGNKPEFYVKEGKKLVWKGPNNVIVLPPTPMLDEEGKQRIDPDGKPMFNPPVVQQRDKHGHPLFNPDGKPVFQTASDKGYDEKGKKIPVKKEKPPKMTPVLISRGTFTVDGMIGKAELNYNIANLKYIYLYAPGIGIAVVSNAPFTGGTLQKNAFKDNTLTVTVGEHTLQLASDKQLLGKKGHPEPAYVAIDRQFTLPTSFPVVGYGVTDRAPYTWPGGRPNAQIAGILEPPPTPKNLMPVLLLAPCPKGEMRKPAPPVLPGQTAPEQPCVLITKALQDQAAAQAAKASTTPAVVPSTTAPAPPPL